MVIMGVPLGRFDFLVVVVVVVVAGILQVLTLDLARLDTFFRYQWFFKLEEELY